MSADNRTARRLRAVATGPDATGSVETMAKSRDRRPRIAHVHQVDGLLREIAALVREGDLLRARGADGAELERNELALERLRWRLAHAARRSAVTEGPQAA